MVGESPDLVERLFQVRGPAVLTEAQQEDLRNLLHLTKVRRGYRHRNGGLSFEFIDPYVNAMYSFDRNRTNLAATIPLLGDRSYMIEGDPIIYLRADEFSGYFKMNEEQILSWDLVSEMMFIAGEVGAQWCSERNIPVVFRGMYENVLRREGRGLNTDVFWKEAIAPGLSTNGQMPYHVVNAYLTLSGKVGSSLTPLRHTGIGLPQYAKVTTPLGRYSDMIAHWQIESALREEARTGKSLKGSTREDYFTHSELSPVVPRLRAREQMLAAAKRTSADFWTFQLIHRAFHHKQAELPETFEVVVGSNMMPDRVNVMWKQYCIRALMLIPSERHVDKTKHEWYARQGDHWEARIKHVHPYWASAIFLEPVRLLHREEESLDEILHRVGGGA